MIRKTYFSSIVYFLPISPQKTLHLLHNSIRNNYLSSEISLASISLTWELVSLAWRSDTVFQRLNMKWFPYPFSRSEANLNGLINLQSACCVCKVKSGLTNLAMNMNICLEQFLQLLKSTTVHCGKCIIMITTLLRVPLCGICQREVSHELTLCELSNRYQGIPSVGGKKTTYSTWNRDNSPPCRLREA